MSRWSLRTSRRSWRKSWRSAGTSPVAGACAKVNIETSNTRVRVSRLRRIEFLLWGLSTSSVLKTGLVLGGNGKGPSRRTHMETQASRKSFAGNSNPGSKSQGEGFTALTSALLLGGRLRDRSHGQPNGFGNPAPLSRQFIEEFFWGKVVATEEQRQQRIGLEFSCVGQRLRTQVDLF